MIGSGGRSASTAIAKIPSKGQGIPIRIVRCAGIKDNGDALLARIRTTNQRVRICVPHGIHFHRIGDPHGRGPLKGKRKARLSIHRDTRTDSVREIHIESVVRCLAKPTLSTTKSQASQAAPSIHWRKTNRRVEWRLNQSVPAVF
jgi:hypothetical protein